jgi:hypothetical protein
MRLVAAAIAMAGISAAISGCAPNGYIDNPPTITLARVDPQDAAERAVTGAVLGATTGAALGAIFAINPGLGATIGTEAGGGLGAVIGAATAQPLPDYKPIAKPTAAIIPGFYDSWPPGYEQPEFPPQTPPPPS